MVTNGLDYEATLYRLIRFMGETVEVRGFDRRGRREFIAGRGELRGGQPILDYARRESECFLFILSDYGAFMVNEGDHIAGETIGDNALRIEQRGFILTIALA